MTVLEQPLVKGLKTRHGMPVLHALEQAADGFVLLMLPSHTRTHLETPDIAAILPDLLQMGATCLSGTKSLTGAVADATLEATLVRQDTDITLPALVVLEDGQVIASISRMRDWATYVERLQVLLGARATGAVEQMV